MLNCDTKKKDGNPCTNTAKYDYKDGTYRCGVHKKKILNEERFLITNSKKTKNKSSPAKSNDSPKDDNIALKQLDNILLNIREKTNKSKNDIDSIFDKIAELKSDYKKLLFEKMKKRYPDILKNQGLSGFEDRLVYTLESFIKALEERPIFDKEDFYPEWIPEKTFVSRVVHDTTDDENYIDFDQSGSELHFKDVNMSIVNCKIMAPSYFMPDWLKKEENVFVGPSHAFPELIKEEPEFFILPDDKYMTRLLQNKVDVERIINNIKTGEEKADKYLSLQGKTLGCVCAPYPCHAMVFIEVVRWLKENNES